MSTLHNITRASQTVRAPTQLREAFHAPYWRSLRAERHLCRVGVDCEPPLYMRRDRQTTQSGITHKTGSARSSGRRSTPCPRP